MKKITLIFSLGILTIGFISAQTSGKEIKFGGRIMYDMAVWGDSTMENAGAEFRRVRFYNSGKLYGNIKYKLQLDFSGGEIVFKDVYIELNELPLQGNLRVGHFKEPFRLEALTSSKYISFMERGLPIAMSRERNTGAMYHTSFGDKLSIQSGVFGEGNSFGNNKDAINNINITSRITYLAINNGDKLLHIGGSNSIRKNNDNTYGFSSRAENHLGNQLISVNFEDVQETNILGGEIAYVNNSLSIQAEYLQTTITEVTETEISSYYVQISYFLTGESKQYKSSLDGFGRVMPNSNYGGGGLGAIELVARISNMNLTAANEGTLDDITVGLNWHLNPNTRVMLNYVRGEMTKGTEISTENAAMMRVQVDF